ncbi:recombinase family protein [Streptomyces sp. KK5PA1]|uniref:Recombinase family protein n=1 Tax=Actinacidiphila acididurans TaxID=2784346 RepID=A0ABS2TMH1_9ACTN|nr:recombinase family protein [Actinacidiphila acididurans]
MSLDEQKLGHGVNSQHLENEEFGEGIGEPVQVRYEDIGISAYSGKERPGYESLLRDIAAGLIRIVIVWHADRLTRDVGEAREFIRLCRTHGVRLFSHQRGGEYNFERSAGRGDFQRDIVAAEEESGHKGERVALSHKRRARNGEWGGGVRPYGWGVDTGRVRSKCINPKADVADRIYEDVPVLDMTKYRPDEAKEIRKWKEELLSGVPMNQLLRDLAKRKVRTVTESGERKRTGKYAETSKWGAVTIRGILTSPRVAGHAEYRGEIVKWHAFPGIITEEERQALITLFSTPGRKTTTGNVTKWLGSLIFECGQCGGGTMRQRLKSPSGTPLYLCNTCNRGRQPAPQLDLYIERVAVERLSRPDIVDLIITSPSVDVEALRDEAATLRQKKNELTLAYVDPDKNIDMAQLEAGTALINKRLNEIANELSAAVSESPLAPFALNYQNAAGLWQGMSLGRKREILRTLLRVELMQAPPRKRGPRPKNYVPEPEELDLSTIIITPR